MRTILFTLAAAAIAAAGTPKPASAQTFWTVPALVNAGEGLVVVTAPPALINAGEGLVVVTAPIGPTPVTVPVLTTARAVKVGPILRVSGCVWARERIPGRWMRFRVCG
jgi:hypothetical protein